MKFKITWTGKEFDPDLPTAVIITTAEALNYFGSKLNTLRVGESYTIERVE